MFRIAIVIFLSFLMLSGTGWLVIWFIMSTSITILNKLLMSIFLFNFPILISFFHMALSTFISIALKPKESDSELNISNNEYELLKRTFGLSLVFTFNIIFGNASLKLCSVSFVQVTKSIVPFITMILSFFVLGDSFSKHHIYACSLVCIGIALSFMGEMKVSSFGFLIVIFGCFLSALKTVLSKVLLSGTYQIDTDELIIRLSPFSSIQTFFIFILSNEKMNLISSKTNFMTPIILMLILISCLLSYFLNYANFMATTYCTPVTIKIVGCLKQVSTVILSVLFFEKHISLINVFGIALTIMGSTYYSFIKKPTNNQNQFVVDEEEEI